MTEDAQNRKSPEDESRRLVLEDGTKIKGYELSYLASGGMSAVYTGVKDGLTYVLKEVDTSISGEVTQLIYEKSLLERLDHPGLPKIHDFFCVDGHYYLVMEFIEGEMLSTFRNSDERPSVEEVVEWGSQLCEIFSYLHAQTPPVIYRDLKGENVILTPEGRIKLIDFGIARVHKGSRVQDTQLMGTPATASPEHYGGTETDARSDIFTLGATLYDLLTGGYRLKRGAFIFAPIRELEPNIPEAVESVLGKALEFKPEDRYQTTQEFRVALLQAVGRPVEALVQGSMVRPATTNDDETSSNLHNARRKRQVSLLALLALVGFVILAIFSLGETGASKNPSLEASLTGDLFRAGRVQGDPVVFLGEDVGLFKVTGWQHQDADERAATLADRLNRFYRTECAACGKTKLEAEDIKVGRYTETGDVVVFYAHVHLPDLVLSGPELLATVDEAQAEALDATPSFVASYWRDLLRDMIVLSRGIEVKDSVAGPDLSEAMLKARKQLSRDKKDIENLREILRELTSLQAAELRTLYLSIPDKKSQPDVFQEIRGYEPLRN